MSDRQLSRTLLSERIAKSLSRRSDPSCGFDWHKLPARILLAVALLLGPAVMHEPGTAPKPGALLVSSAQAADAAGFREFLRSFREEAQQAGISSATFDVAFDGVEPDLSLPDLVIPRPPSFKKPGQAEFTKTPAQYLSPKSLEWLVENGRLLYDEHRDTLTRVAQKFGVQPSVVLAIWGRETTYGRWKLKHDPIVALATQAYVGRRKDYFRRELLDALRMLQDGMISRAEMRQHGASWAGAMGLTQFMPSDIYKHAEDFDGDGKRDVWNSVPDALASAAKQLRDKGWEAGRTWGYEVRPPAGLACHAEGDQRSIGEWERLGFTRTGGRSFPSNRHADTANLLLPAGSFGPAFLMLTNFQVIKEYNRADLYALFVGHLADRIAGGGEFERRWSDIGILSNEEIEEVQTRLNSAGFDAGKTDGFLGAKTRRALGAYQAKFGLAVDCWPGKRSLAHLRGQP